jgi:hypothetical protein
VRVCLALLAIILNAQPSRAADPLWLYNGAWQVTRKPGAPPEQLKNECAYVGKFFACQQTVNGQLSALMVFVPKDKPGQYFTQSINPQGRATGRGDLEISGDRWIYTSNWDEGGKTTFYRTTNVFTGKTHIHFEQEESSDGKQWKVTGSGEEVRAAR